VEVVVKVTVPVKIDSGLNMRVHWRVRANTNASHRAAAYFALKQAKVKAEMPAVVTLTRIAPRELDDDNLAGGFKSVRDGTADWLGIDDRDKRVQWRYEQRKGAPKVYEATVRIEAVTEALR
jgi:hypothetical protein